MASLNSWVGSTPDLESASTPISFIPMNSDQAETEFLKLCTNDPRNITDKRVEGTELLRHMSSLVGNDAIQTFRATLQKTYHASSTDFNRILWALCTIIKVLRSNPAISIPRLSQTLIQEGVFENETELNGNLTVRHCTMSLIGWCSLLYIPSRTIATGSFDLDTKSAKCFTCTSLKLESADRPIDELLRLFGELLPKRKPETDLQKEKNVDVASEKFHVSHLNVSTLKRLANIKIVWVDTVSAHLDFDPTVPVLHIFKAPSYCKWYDSNETILSIITKDFYDEHELPTRDFSYQRLMGEIILSYGLLFRDWRSARNLYRTEDRKRALIKGIQGKESVDPWLDKLCGMDIPQSRFYYLFSKQGIRETYDSEANFPILSKRLRAIQNYIEGIQPSHVSSLWYDRRDLRLWYTVWIVLILGGISIIQAAISIFLSGVQIAIANKSYSLQLQQSPPSP